MKITYKSIAIFISSIFLLGCHNGYSHLHGNYKYFEKVQLMTNDDYRASQLIKQLQSKGVKVFASKDEKGNSKIELLIFANDIFNTNSANLNSAAYAVLDNIVELFGLYEEEVVQIICNQNKGYGGVVQRSALALAQAYKVVDSLRDDDVDVRFMYADKSEQIPPGYIKISFQNYKR